MVFNYTSFPLRISVTTIKVWYYSSQHHFCHSVIVSVDRGVSLKIVRLVSGLLMVTAN